MGETFLAKPRRFIVTFGKSTTGIHMKNTLIAILLLGPGWLFASSAPIKLGGETDYVATAVADVGSPYAPNLTSSTGSYGDKGVRVFFGYFMRKMEPANLPATLSLLQLRLAQVLGNDRWKTSLRPESASESANPKFFFSTGTRGNETLEVYVILFPADDGVVKIAYEQRRSFPEPNQSAQPTRPTGG
ncbi:hypothetical protein [Opitutus sp. GAS368]|uniref:hypothetical protein n=1 Tax=Opitutus sp. GAS368 TaxID=1882749 RepID=UPI0012FE107F|nr:hypothetical protein [Opitutus sp. GAS368]